MRRVYFGADNIITSLGFSTEENAGNIKSGNTGIKVLEDKSLSPGPVAYSAVNSEKLERNFTDSLKKSCISASEIRNFSRLEKMFITSITDALQDSGVDTSDPRTLLVISTTKGNIDRIASIRQSTIDNRQSTILLWEMAGFIAQLFNCSICSHWLSAMRVLQVLWPLYRQPG